MTRGIIEVLAEARNPFSILTKGTLILRDLDLLADAARRTPVETCFSVGTLDEEVWKATEPGTPHPMRRIEAVARLNDAGVPCGVLLAPILTGLSDRRDQLEAVVRACVDAGAPTISPVLLHLRPGVREHYLGWLQRERPELADEYARRYRRAYAASSERAAVANTVRELVQRHRGRRGTSPTSMSTRFDPVTRDRDGFPSTPAARWREAEAERPHSGA
ncbi:MAG: hypothetical protein JOZ99_03675 [Actinobacteria bacterium]|nr:hypothetical protein [Actinomycetota bacterium]